MDDDHADLLWATAADCWGSGCLAGRWGPLWVPRSWRVDRCAAMQQTSVCWATNDVIVVAAAKLGQGCAAAPPRSPETTAATAADDALESIVGAAELGPGNPERRLRLESFNFATERPGGCTYATRGPQHAAHVQVPAGASLSEASRRSTLCQASGLLLCTFNGTSLMPLPQPPSLLLVLFPFLFSRFLLSLLCPILFFNAGGGQTCPLPTGPRRDHRRLFPLFAFFWFVPQLPLLCSAGGFPPSLLQCGDAEPIPSPAPRRPIRLRALLYLVLALLNCATWWGCGWVSTCESPTAPLQHHKRILLRQWAQHLTLEHFESPPSCIVPLLQLQGIHGKVLMDNTLLTHSMPF